jgi:hypothetical protein
VSGGVAYGCALAGFLASAAIVISVVFMAAPGMSNLQLLGLMAVLTLAWPACTAGLAYMLYRWAFLRTRVAP